MAYRKNTIRCEQFTRENFVRTVWRASDAPEGAAPNRQTIYLAEHLQALGARSLIIEEHYIDRHFIEEYSTYYSRCLGEIPNYCKRIHVFTSDLDESSLTHLVGRASAGEAVTVQRELQRAYRGFIVVRPLPSVPIGRTVLCSVEKSMRTYLPALPHSVHLLGIELTVYGIAFQQQDVAVAACATTAIWTALQRVVRNEGGRPPTPSAITQAAAKYIQEGRALPGQHGLTVNQICEALRVFDFAPEVIRVADSPDQFLRYLNIYIRSGIPVILCLGGVTGHAVTVVGYEQSAAVAKAHRTELTVFDSPESRGTKKVDLALLNTAYNTVFVHDDRVGPYARARLSIESRAGSEGKVDGTAPHDLYIEIEFPDGALDRRPVKLAAVPLYTKLRSSAQDLSSSAFQLPPSVPRSDADTVSLELFFMRSGSYTSSLYEKGLDADRLLKFQRSASLSRYVGVVRWYVDGEPVLDTIWDTTDIRRKSRFDKPQGLLAIVALHSSYEGFVDRCAEDYGVIAG